MQAPPRRLCIIQTSEEDKHWQIRYMYEVYRSCKLCVVLPGGLQRVADIDEPTTWIHRSWTLQETLAPPEAIIVFRWRLGPGTARVPMVGSFPITAVPRASEVVMLPLRLVLVASTVGSMIFTPNAEGKEEVSVRVSIFSAHPPPPWHADSSKDSQPRILAANVSALSMAMEPEVMADPDRRAHAVWQSSLMRTSSRPVDMVFSIMGLFGVELDPGSFDVNDRRGATIALARAVLQAGGRANWLGVACRVPPDISLSMFPTLPRTSVAGMALVKVGKDRIQEISELVDPVYPVPDKLVPLPEGSINTDGCLVASVKSVPVWQVQSTAPSNASHVWHAFDGTFWQLSPPNDEGSGEPKVFAALLGWFHWYYPRWVISEDDTENIRRMLLETRRRKAEDGDNEGRAVSVRSFICVNQSEREVVLPWTERRFCIRASDTHELNMPDPSAGMSESGTGKSGSTGKSVPKPSIAEVQQTYFEAAHPWPAGSSGNKYVNECRRQALAAQPYKTVWQSPSLSVSDGLTVALCTGPFVHFYVRSALRLDQS